MKGACVSILRGLGTGRFEAVPSDIPLLLIGCAVAEVEYLTGQAVLRTNGTENSKIVLKMHCFFLRFHFKNEHGHRP